MPAPEPARDDAAAKPSFGPEWLDRAVRFAWTAMSFTLFGLGGLAVGIVVFPLLALVVRDKDRRERMTRGIVSQLFRAFIAIMAQVGLTYRVRGAEPGDDGAPVNAPNASGVGTLVVANHPTLIDVVFLLALFPGAVSVVKRAHWFNPFMMATVRMARYIPNHDTTQLLDSAEQRLRQGECLILFPEGTRTVPGQPVRFRRGAALAALRAGADILPIRITCEPLLLHKHSPWYHVPVTRPRWTFEVLDRLPADEFQAMGDSERSRSQALTAELQSRLTGGVK
ncbi:lysophospholipid acyltransferase family protein [Marinihelvus fidelis]|nr:lysophospholipid acyltransferase family protein [Marinihelvus fidelis]